MDTYCSIKEVGVMLSQVEVIKIVIVYASKSLSFENIFISWKMRVICIGLYADPSTIDKGKVDTKWVDML